MAKSKIDAKEFMLQYGDRIGLGVAGFLALLFVIFAILGGGSGVSAEQVKESSRKADEAIKRSEINPDKIALKDEPSVKPLDQIDLLSKSLIKPIVTDQLTLPIRYFEGDPLRGKFRSNPNVMQALEVEAVPFVGSIRLYETRVVNKVEEPLPRGRPQPRSLASRQLHHHHRLDTVGAGKRRDAESPDVAADTRSGGGGSAVPERPGTLEAGRRSVAALGSLV